MYLDITAVNHVDCLYFLNTWYASLLTYVEHMPRWLPLRIFGNVYLGTIITQAIGCSPLESLCSQSEMMMECLVFDEPVILEIQSGTVQVPSFGWWEMAVANNWGHRNERTFCMNVESTLNRTCDPVSFLKWSPKGSERYFITAILGIRNELLFELLSCSI